MLNYIIISIDTITASSTSLFNTVYNNYNIMNRGCKYTSKEIINMILWIYTTYIIMCDLMFIEKLVFRIPEKLNICRIILFLLFTTLLCSMLKKCCTISDI